MPAWIHDRAQHLLAKNPSMTKAKAFAIATQQSHAAGKTPKDYGTPQGKREAKAKFDKPKKEYVKTPNPGGLETPKLRDREKEAMPLKMLQRAAQARGVDPSNIGALKQIARTDLPATRRREIAKNVVSYLRGIKTAAMRDELLLICKEAGLKDVLSRLWGKAPVAMTGGQVRAHGVMAQMAKDPRRFAAPAVDPTLKVRQEAAARARALGGPSLQLAT